jgi:hypothetical protein
MIPNVTLIIHFDPREMSAKTTTQKYKSFTHKWIMNDALMAESNDTVPALTTAQL